MAFWKSLGFACALRDVCFASLVFQDRERLEMVAALCVAAFTIVFAMVAPVRRMRSNGFACAARANFVEAALGEELRSLEVGFFAEGIRTKHVHYTHGRHSDLGIVQPDAMSRKDFWEQCKTSQQNIVNRL